MNRTLPALIVLTLAACSSSSGNTSGTSASGGNGPGGSVSASASSGAGSTSGGANGSTSGGANGSTSGGVQGTTGGSAGGPVTANNFNRQLNEAVCRFISACDETSYAPAILDVLCQGSEQFDFQDLPAALDAGRVSFNPTAAQACVDALNTGVCAQTVVLPCLPFIGNLGGLVLPAGDCYTDRDCLSGSCNGYDTTTCSAGTCSGIVAVGGACACTDCGACDLDAGLSCIASVCTAPAGVGQPCGSGNPNCDLGLVCPDTTCASVPISAGNECSPTTGDCVSGLYCFEKQNQDFGNCATQIAAGQPCGEDLDHQGSIRIGADNECTGLHPVCRGSGTLYDAGIVPGTCAQLSNVGDPCTPPNDAINSQDHAYYDGCYVGLNCKGGVCVTPPGIGKACATDGIPCDQTKSYCVDAGSGANCLAFIPLGGTCTGVLSGECGNAANCNSNNICQGSAPSCSPTL